MPIDRSQEDAASPYLAKKIVVNQTNQKFFLKNKAEYYDYQNTIENNIYHLTQEHVTLGLLSDDRKEKRKLGKDLIVKARLDKPKIKGIRFFTQQEFVNDVNFKMVC